MSPDGRCHTFDARANGYVRGEGGGVVVLKPLAAALAEGEVAGGALLSIGAVIAGEPQRFPAVGVSGDLLGAVGTYEFVLLRRDPDGSTVFSSAFHLRR